MLKYIGFIEILNYMIWVITNNGIFLELEFNRLD